MKASDKATLLATLRSQFEKNTARHKGIDWSLVEARLEAHPKKLETLLAMENTAGEPDVIGYDHNGAESYYASRGFRGRVDV